MTVIEHVKLDQMEAALPQLISSPKDHSPIEMIIVRPGVDERLVVDEAEIVVGGGIVGDSWSRRPSKRTPDQSPHPDMQITVINRRLLELITDSEARWPLAGDQLVVDFDLSHENLPVGSRIAVGTAVLEATDQPHTGCAKFSQRFGRDALKFVNTKQGMSHRLRGANFKVVQAGTVKVGDLFRKLDR